MSHNESEIYTTQVRKGAPGASHDSSLRHVDISDTEKDGSERFSIASKIVYMQDSALCRCRTNQTVNNSVF